MALRCRNVLWFVAVALMSNGGWQPCPRSTLNKSHQWYGFINRLTQQEEVPPKRHVEHPHGSCCSASPLPLLRTAFVEKHFTVNQNLYRVKGNKGLSVSQSLGGWVLRAVEAALVCSLHGRAAGCLSAALACMGRGCAVYLGDCWSLHSPSHMPVTWCRERTPGGQLISEGGQKSAAQT